MYDHAKPLEEFGKTKKEVVVTYFVIWSQYHLGKIYDNYRNTTISVSLSHAGECTLRGLVPSGFMTKTVYAQ
jgi:hypothetical protein